VLTFPAFLHFHVGKDLGCHPVPPSPSRECSPWPHANLLSNGMRPTTSVFMPLPPVSPRFFFCSPQGSVPRRVGPNDPLVRLAQPIALVVARFGTLFDFSLSFSRGPSFYRGREHFSVVKWWTPTDDSATPSGSAGPRNHTASANDLFSQFPPCNVVGFSFLPAPSDSHLRCHLSFFFPVFPLSSGIGIVVFPIALQHLRII